MVDSRGKWDHKTCVCNHKIQEKLHVNRVKTTSFEIQGLQVPTLANIHHMDTIKVSISKNACNDTSFNF
ncbi:hypothetical protein Mapa_005486 [Marchantia paleacea]|nr:hypothetical protein Mapa_005486 [Marchantia paleacea]